MCSALYVVRDKATGMFINSAPTWRGAELFIDGIENAFTWDDIKPAQCLSDSLSHDGRVCEVVEIKLSEGGQS